MIYFCIIFLDYYDNLKYDSIKKEDKLFKLLIVDNKDELESLVKDEQLLSKYRKRIIYLSNDKDYWKDMMSEESEEFFRKQEAYLNGYDARQQEMILDMHANNEPLEKISKYFKLTLEEVQAIIDASKNDNK